MKRSSEEFLQEMARTRGPGVSISRVSEMQTEISSRQGACLFADNIAPTLYHWLVGKSAQEKGTTVFP